MRRAGAPPAASPSRKCRLCSADLSPMVATGTRVWGRFTDLRARPNPFLTITVFSFPPIAVCVRGGAGSVPGAWCIDGDGCCSGLQSKCKGGSAWGPRVGTKRVLGVVQRTCTHPGGEISPPPPPPPPFVADVRPDLPLASAKPATTERAWALLSHAPDAAGSY
jgi:hypothetical protein